jgi:DNA-binding NarL/FixJ family response regulator
MALAGSGDEDDLRRAHERLLALGARPAAAIVARRLRERGIRGVARGPRPATREHPAGLTRRELDVLESLAEGLTNAEIAARLVISEKTVGHHVSAILGKLGVGSRYEAAKLATEDRELAPPR